MSGPPKLETLWAAQAMSWSATASVTVLIWDALTTFDEEITLVWPLAKTYWIKWAYLWNRYYTLVTYIILFVQNQTAIDTKTHRAVLSHSACVHWFHFRVVTSSLQHAFVQPVLIARVRALYNCNRLVTGILLLVYLADVITVIVLCVVVLPQIPIGPVCFPPENDLSEKRFYAATILPPLALESIMLVLTIYKLIAIRRMPNARPGAFIDTLLRDGLWAFFVVFAAVFTNQIMQLSQTGLMMWVANGWVATAFSFVSSRLILNMLHYAPVTRSAPSGISSALSDPSSRRRALGGANYDGEDADQAKFTSHVQLDYEMDAISYDRIPSRRQAPLREGPSAPTV